MKGIAQVNSAVFAGTFDPFTVGHLDIIERIAGKFDNVYVALLVNPGKQRACFSVEDRIELIKDATKSFNNIKIVSHAGLLVDLCHELNASFIIRGLRDGGDVAYERQLEAVNRRLAPDIETLYLLARPDIAHISSSLVRQLMCIGVSIDGLVPNAKHRIFLKGNISQ